MNLGKIVLLIGAALVLFAVLSSRDTSSSPAATVSSGARPMDRSSTAPAEPPLELVRYTWHIEYGYAILEGQVKNISAQPLNNVSAVASFYDADEGFITSSDALIEYNPVLPGQTSPFKVMATQNPAMRKAGVEFKELFGGTIRYRRAEAKKNKKN